LVISPLASASSSLVQSPGAANIIAPENKEPLVVSDIGVRAVHPPPALE